MTVKRELPAISFRSREEWEAWLQDEHETSGGLWLRFAKKGSGFDSVSPAEAVEVALCYGWIDGQAASVDEKHWLVRFTPRRPRSRWSKINRTKAEELIEQGRMRPAGLREVERAKADGRWDAAYDGQRSAKVPDDLREALERSERAREAFSALSRAERYAILYRIEEAKKPETRARRIAKFVGTLEEGKKLY
ncbi:MAG: YdeI/OmpD-associated family protein [Thermoleophilaceae bacterium]|nr:YdeI/OmpD-associated family protein [Thermoleophilaceae bacterium]